jgi:hypothetical protein
MGDRIAFSSLTDLIEDSAPLYLFTPVNKFAARLPMLQ